MASNTTTRSNQGTSPPNHPNTPTTKLIPARDAALAAECAMIDLNPIGALLKAVKLAVAAGDKDTADRLIEQVQYWVDTAQNGLDCFMEEVVSGVRS